MIPKTIHYCWFGRNPKPKLANKCIQSWRKHCPDYEIIEWNEDNFDISSAPLYVRQAYEAKKWAFVSDYVRLYAMVNFGGIYMDTDVEVLKSLDSFLLHEAFSGFEDEVSIPTGIMACEKGFPLFAEFLKYYDAACFVNKDGSINTTTNVRIITNICMNHGLKRTDEFQIIEGFALYPHDYFCPISYTSGKMEKTKRTATIHWFAGSWQTAEQKRSHAENARQVNRANILHSIRYAPNRLTRWMLGTQRYEKLKEILKRK